MRLYTINTGYFKLDGGAMFGVVPKTIWQKLNPPDENNLCTWAMRCLLIEDGNKLILVDNGIGDKQDAKFMSHYYLHGDDTLDKSLAKHGFHPNDVTDVILTHLHFDHCGGSIKRDGEKLIPAFKNAIYWSNQQHWEWAVNPNEREKASFLLSGSETSVNIAFIAGIAPPRNKLDKINSHGTIGELPRKAQIKNKVALTKLKVRNIFFLPTKSASFPPLIMPIEPAIITPVTKYPAFTSG